MRCKNYRLKHFYNTFFNFYLTDFQYFILNLVKLFLSHIIIGKHYTKLQYEAGNSSMTICLIRVIFVTQVKYEIKNNQTLS